MTCARALIYLSIARAFAEEALLARDCHIPVVSLFYCILIAEFAQPHSRVHSQPARVTSWYVQVQTGLQTT